MRKFNSLRSLGVNAFFQVVEKIIILSFSFINMFFLIRMLDTDDYGIWGIVFGYYGFLQLINLAAESILWKEHKKWRGRSRWVLSAFEAFNVIKFILLITISIIMGEILAISYDNKGFLFAFIAVTVMMTTDSLVAHLVAYASANYKHSIITKINFKRVLFSFCLLLFFIYSPSLFFLMVKEILVASFVYYLWHKEKPGLVGRYFFPKFNRAALHYVFYKVKSYSIWTHLSGSITYFIYRADTIFLSFFVSLTTVGYYNIALSLANLANILPGVLAQQNSVAISNVESEVSRNNITKSVLRVSVIVGFVTLLFYLMLSDWLIALIAPGSPVDEVYTYVIPVVFGLIIVKSIASPIVSYININGSVKLLCLRVNLPTLIFSSILYYFSASKFGPVGVAYSNIANSLLWLVLIVIESKRIGFNFDDIFNFKKDYILFKAKIIKSES